MDRSGERTRPGRSHAALGSGPDQMPANLVQALLRAASTLDHNSSSRFREIPLTCSIRSLHQSRRLRLTLRHFPDVTEPALAPQRRLPRSRLHILHQRRRAFSSCAFTYRHGISYRTSRLGRAASGRTQCAALYQPSLLRQAGQRLWVHVLGRFPCWRAASPSGTKQARTQHCMCKKICGMNSCSSPGDGVGSGAPCTNCTRTGSLHTPG